MQKFSDKMRVVAKDTNICLNKLTYNYSDSFDNFFLFLFKVDCLISLAFCLN